MSSNTAIVRDATERYRTARREAGESRGAFEAEIKRLGGTPRVETAIRRDTAPSQVAELLGVASTDQTVIRARHMYDGDRLVQLADSYVPLDVAEAAGVENPDPGLGGIISRMRDAGFEQTEAIEEVALYAASSIEAEAFGVEVGTNLLRITHTGYTKTGRAVEVTVHRPGPGWVLRYSPPIS
ncbi:UTRA domain-containing protein [Streptomyces sp. 3214.6]|uniref:UTRA domain-containing protein n=1 Tax=Streptomyces sp. 3214.6 TaxID=1882757 RepID=UPI000909D6BA|nr:UTRA domain-containing protein [Streptomyces sp. 3214.6]SHI19883.1 GntR family transcriptional regulator [Streptomyces sp. 3214.6]